MPALRWVIPGQGPVISKVSINKISPLQGGIFYLYVLYLDIPPGGGDINSPPAVRGGVDIQ